ncbi:hypothetical protein [Amycolatopsis sp. NPDC004079]|uniref:hypothetical protein n=1 Tax=Amycolatopsis sp. NPDC004079 TaxID=3154549 RepID=UPI0033A015CF
MSTAADDTAADFPFVAIVHRPGLPDVHLGFAFEHQARQAAWSLADDLHNTSHIQGTTVGWSPTPESATSLAPVPTDPCVLAALIAGEPVGEPTGRAFPDLYSRLKAQEGYDASARIWGDACRWLDHVESAPD